MSTENTTIKRRNSSNDGWDIIHPITIGQNIYGSSTNYQTPLLNSSDQIDSAFLGNVAKTNVDNAFSTTQTITGSDDTPLNLKATHSTMSNIAFFNSSSTRLGNIGANGYVPYWWGGQGNNGQIALVSPTITLASTQITSQTPLVLSLTSAQQSIVEDLNNTIIKIDISAFYTAIGLDSPYAWIKRNAIKNIGDSTNGAVLYEFICNSNDIDASASLTKLGNIGVYYFYQTVGTYATYNKAIIISSAKITLSNLSHATNLQNGTGNGSLVQIPITSTFSFSNAGSGQSGTKTTGATAVDSTVLGGISLASGDSSLAGGKNNIASGYSSVAFGSNTYSGGNMTFTEGEQTTATGSNSHAGGQGTIAQGGNQFVIGRWNSANSTDLFIVGNGSSNSSRANAFSVSQEGYAKCVGLTDGTTQKTITQILTAVSNSATFSYDSNTGTLTITT